MGKLKMTKMVYGRAMVGTDAYKRICLVSAQGVVIRRENKIIVQPQLKPI